jgi:hypothetical protein
MNREEPCACTRNETGRADHESRVNVMPARSLGNARLGRQTFLNNPQLLGARPPPAPLRVGENS